MKPSESSTKLQGKRGLNDSRLSSIKIEKWKVDLRRVLQRPEAHQKVDSKKSITFHSLKLNVVIMRTSTTKKILSIFYEREIFTHVICPSICAFLRRRQRPSITKIKSRGDKGHPCLIPRPLWKKRVGKPLINIEYVPVVTQHII